MREPARGEHPRPASCSTPGRDAKNLKRVVIVNGLEPGQLTRALDGEDVGTVIMKGGADERAPHHRLARSPARR